MGEKTILVIDDDLSILETIDFLLTSEGYSVLLAPNGEDGLEIIKEQWIDAIILDLRMPKISGYLFANMVTRSSKNPDIKIMILTAESLMVGQSTISLPNVRSKMTKPFDAEELKQNIIKLMA
jgi:CheY-like chemotaxis protein